MFTHVQCCDIVPSLVSSFGESLDTGLYFAPQLPRGFDHFYGAGQGGEPPLPTVRGGAGNPPLPAGRGVHPYLSVFWIALIGLDRYFLSLDDNRC